MSTLVFSFVMLPPESHSRWQTFYFLKGTFHPKMKILSSFIHHHVLPNLTWIFILRTFKIATSRFDVNATNLGQKARKMTLNFGLFLTLKYVHQLYRPFFMVFCVLWSSTAPGHCLLSLNRKQQLNIFSKCCI